MSRVDRYHTHVYHDQTGKRRLYTIMQYSWVRPGSYIVDTFWVVEEVTHWPGSYVLDDQRFASIDAAKSAISKLLGYPVVP